MHELEQADPVDQIYAYANRRMPRVVKFGEAILMHKREACFMFDIARRLGPGLYVELGTYRGGSALCIASGMKTFNIDAHLISVDLYDQRNIGNIRLMETTPKDLQKQVQNRLKGHYLDQYVTLIKGDTAKTAAKFADKQFNFLFIDADHSYEGCKADFDAWSPLVKPGGMIAFHDNTWPGVAQVINEIPWGRKYRTYCKTLTVFTKPGEEDAAG